MLTTRGSVSTMSAGEVNTVLQSLPLMPFSSASGPAQVNASNIFLRYTLRRRYGKNLDADCAAAGDTLTMLTLSVSILDTAT